MPTTEKLIPIISMVLVALIMVTFGARAYSRYQNVDATAFNAHHASAGVSQQRR